MLFELIGLLINLGFVSFLFFMVLSIVKGAPYVRSKRASIDAMVTLSAFTDADRILDFGAGDGEVVLAFAKSGARQVRGIEINLFLVIFANLRILMAGKWSVARVYWRNMWWYDTEPYSIVIVYGFPNIMNAISTKLTTESSVKRVVISNSFYFTQLKQIGIQDGVTKYLIDA